jgi:hypothetical protein
VCDLTHAIGFGIRLSHRRAVSIAPIMRDERPENRSSITVGESVQSGCCRVHFGDGDFAHGMKLITH